MTLGKPQVKVELVISGLIGGKYQAVKTIPVEDAINLLAQYLRDSGGDEAAAKARLHRDLNRVKGRV